MLPLLKYRVMSELSQVSARQRMGPITSADKIGKSGEPCGVPRSGSSSSIMWLLNSMVIVCHFIKLLTHAII